MICAESSGYTIRMAQDLSRYFRLTDICEPNCVYWYEDDLSGYVSLPTIAPTLLMVWE